MSFSIIGLFGTGSAMAEWWDDDNDNFNYDGYSARQVKDIANCISGVDTSTSLCSERGSQGWHDWAKQNLRNDTRGEFTMMDNVVEIRLVGVNVDNRADGKGKAGLTFMTTTYVGESPINLADTNNNAGGYRDVRNRKDFNQGRYKSTISSSVYKYLTPVLKVQDNQANTEMNNYGHSATSNAIVEKISMPSPLELNMNVTRRGSTGNNYNGLTPTGIKQYNPKGVWSANYAHLYSGNAPYEYYQSNTSNVSEYCKLIKGDGTYNSRWWNACNGVPKGDTHIYLRSVCGGFKNFATFSNFAGNLFVERPNKLETSHVAALFSF